MLIGTKCEICKPLRNHSMPCCTIKKSRNNKIQLIVSLHLKISFPSQKNEYKVKDNSVEEMSLETLWGIRKCKA